MRKRYTEEDIRERLRKAVQGEPTKWAGEHGISHTYVLRALAGKDGVGIKIAEALGFAKRETSWYERMDPAAPGGDIPRGDAPRSPSAF